MDIKSKLTVLANESLIDQSQFVVDVIVSSRNISKIIVIIDGDNGISIEDCSTISRVISGKIDKLELVSNSFSLEVTTPGLDSPLRMPRQFVKNIGRKLRIHKTDKEIIEGILKAVNTDDIVIVEERKDKKKIIEEEKILSFNELEKVFVLISFKN